MPEVIQTGVCFQDLFRKHFIGFRGIPAEESPVIVCHNFAVPSGPIQGFLRHFHQSHRFLFINPRSRIRDSHSNGDVAGDTVKGQMVLQKSGRSQNALPALFGKAHQKIKGRVDPELLAPIADLDHLFQMDALSEGVEKLL